MFSAQDTESLHLQVVLPEGVRYDTFKVPECPECLLEDRQNSIVRPPSDVPITHVDPNV